MNAMQWQDGTPIYRQLKERVVAMMLDGELKPGDALPSVRQVAAEGLVEKRRGLGMYVTEQATRGLRQDERERFLRDEWPPVLERIRRLGLSLADLIALDNDKGTNA